MITRKCKHFNDYKLIQVLCKNKIMTTNILYTQDKLTSLAYFETNPYEDVDGPTISVSSDYDYENTYAEAYYAIDNQRFNQFLVDEVFKITYNNGEEQKTFTSNDYIQGINFAKDGNNTNYDSVSSYYKIESDSSSENPVSHSAGTIFTSNVNNNFNIGIIFEETYNLEDSRIESSVNVELRNEEPLMQSLIDCNGTVYDFKKGVKLSDFSKFVEQKTKDTPKGYVEFNCIAPTNLSTNKTNNESGTQSINEINKIYTLEELDQPELIDNLININKTFTRFNGYVVFCSFHTEPQSQSTSLLQYKPYITVIRCMWDKLPIYFNSIKTKYGDDSYDDYDFKNSTYIEQLEHKNSKIILGNYLIYDSVFYESYRISHYATDVTNNIINNYYILEDSK